MSIYAESNMNPFAKIVFSIFLVLLFLMLFQVIGMAIFFYMLHTGFSLESIAGLPTELTNPANAEKIRIVQAVQSIGTLLLPALIICFVAEKRSLSFFKIDTKVSRTFWIITLLLALSAIPLINYLGSINARMHLPASLQSVEQWMKALEDQAEIITKIIVASPDVPVLFVNIVVVAIIPAIAEEFLFRGILMQQFTELTRSKHAGIWISAVIFSIFHMQFFGFVPRMLLGTLFGYLFLWSGSLWMPVFAHFMNNATAVLFYFMMERGIIDKRYETMDAMAISPYIIIVSMLATTGLIAYIYSRRSQAQGLL